MPLDISVIGTAEPFSTVAVRAQITGELTSVNFKEGDDVTKGQVLFTLDRRPLEGALQQAQANLERDTGAGREREVAGAALSGPGRSRHRDEGTGRHVAHRGRGARRDGRRRSRRGRKREGAAAVRDDHGADLRAAPAR